MLIIWFPARITTFQSGAPAAGRTGLDVVVGGGLIASRELETRREVINAIGLGNRRPRISKTGTERYAFPSCFPDMCGDIGYTTI